MSNSWPEWLGIVVEALAWAISERYFFHKISKNPLNFFYQVYLAANDSLISSIVVHRKTSPLNLFRKTFKYENTLDKKKWIFNGILLLRFSRHILALDFGLSNYDFGLLRSFCNFWLVIPSFYYLYRFYFVEKCSLYYFLIETMNTSIKNLMKTLELEPTGRIFIVFLLIISVLTVMPCDFIYLLIIFINNI